MVCSRMKLMETARFVLAKRRRATAKQEMHMRYSMGGGSGGKSGGGSILNKNSGGSAADKQKLLKMNADDRYTLMTARKTAEIQAKMLSKRLDVVDESGEPVMQGKAKKLVQAMISSQTKATIDKANKTIKQREKKREEVRKMLNGANGTPAAAALKLAQAQQAAAMTQQFINNFYNKDGTVVKSDKKDDNGWW